jgi:hypothetical protein
VPGLADKRCVSFEEEGRRGYFIRHQNFQFSSASRAEDSDQPLFDRDATFIWRPVCRFESVNFDKHFLRHQDFSIFLHAASEPEPDLLYQYDSAWTLKPAPIF